jgi:hypothetical protein
MKLANLMGNLGQCSCWWRFSKNAIIDNCHFSHTGAASPVAALKVQMTNSIFPAMFVAVVKLAAHCACSALRTA